MTPDTRCHLCSHRQGSTCPTVGPLPARWLVRHGASLAPRGCPLPPPDEVEPRRSCAQTERPCPVSTCRMVMIDGECALDHAEHGSRDARVIAALLGVTYETVRVTEAKALRRLRVLAPNEGFERAEEEAA